VLDPGHDGEILSGPPYPHLDCRVKLHKLPGLDLYNPDHLFKVKEVRDLAYPFTIGFTL